MMSEDEKPVYLEAVSKVERLHRLFLDLLKDEFDRIGWQDITPVQALMIFNVGASELTVGELKTRGYYLGSNVSYNLKKLVELKYIDQERSTTDKRSIRIRLTSRGVEAANIISALYDRHISIIERESGLSLTDLEVLNVTLSKLERFWGNQIRFKAL